MAAKRLPTVYCTSSLLENRWKTKNRPSSFMRMAVVAIPRYSRNTPVSIQCYCVHLAACMRHHWWHNLSRVCAHHAVKPQNTVQVHISILIPCVVSEFRQTVPKSACVCLFLMRHLSPHTHSSNASKIRNKISSRAHARFYFGIRR